MAWTLDEKMGQTYIHQEVANTLAARDYKQPQAVIYEDTWDDKRPDNPGSKRGEDMLHPSEKGLQKYDGGDI